MTPLEKRRPVRRKIWNYHFSEKFENDAIEFDYLLKEGPSHSTNAIRLLKHMGFDQRIVEEALAIIQTNADEIAEGQRQ